jgi:hypothetical protein
MKKRNCELRILVILIILGLPAISIGQNFNKLTNSTDSTYGYSPYNPLKLKKGDPAGSIKNTREFLLGLKTNDGQELELLGRSSMGDPNFKEPKIMLEKLGKGGILDRYTFLTSNTKDTIRLYVDIYHKEKLMVPVGLKFVRPE